MESLGFEIEASETMSNSHNLCKIIMDKKAPQFVVRKKHVGQLLATEVASLLSEESETPTISLAYRSLSGPNVTTHLAAFALPDMPGSTPVSPVQVI